MRKSILLSFIVFVCLLAYQPAIAQEPLLLKKDFTSITPIFMEGHANDMDWIQGYRFEGDIILDGVKIGTVNGEATLLNPPIDMSQQYYEAFGIFNNNLDDIGSFQVFAQVKSYGGESSASTGDGIIAWHGSITNSSGALQGLKGLSAGTGNYNLFTGKGAGTELLQITLE